MNTNHSDAAQLAPRARRDLAERTRTGALISDETGLRQQIEAVQQICEQAETTVWRRALFLWLRIYQFEKVPGRKAKILDLRIPIPLPVLGIFFRRTLTWDQALRVVKAQRSGPEQDVAEPYLGSCMAVEFLRIEEEKEHKQELLVIGID